MRFALLLALTSCVAVEERATCQTTCGMFFVGPFPTPDRYTLDAPEWSCGALQAVESGIIARFPAANDGRFRAVCPLLYGWVVRMNPKRSWIDPNWGEVDGLTDCRLGETVIGNKAPDRSALPHEMAHAVQNCQPNACAHPGVDDQHWCWSENGVYLAAASANLEASWRMKDGGQ